MKTKFRNIFGRNQLIGAFCALMFVLISSCGKPAVPSVAPDLKTKEKVETANRSEVEPTDWMMDEPTAGLRQTKSPACQSGTCLELTSTPQFTQSNGLADCSGSHLGAILFTERTSGESTAPYLIKLVGDGYAGLSGTPTYEAAAEFFPQLDGWDRAQICNSHDCLRTRGERASNEGLEYEYLAYGPERLGGVPDDEKFNLPWATQVAREIADKWDKKLIISYSTKQLHQEAEERGYDWRDPSEVVAVLAPYGDVWMLQAADEYWRLDDGTVRPILSQRVYPPGPEFRAEVERWVNWVRTANPNIEVWIQLATQRIGVSGESEPSAELLLKYREWISDLVDGIYIMPIYGSIEQMPAANQAMDQAFRCACGGSCDEINPPLRQPNQDITLIEEGWTDDVTLPCPPSGECLTILPNYYYRIYENTRYPCGSDGNHQFIVLDHTQDPSIPRHLFAKFLGGAVGFWYLDGNGNRVYYPHERAVGIITESYNRNMFFRSTVSKEFANGVTKQFRENRDFRLIMPSYCSHDLYLGEGEYNEIDGFDRWGYLAAMEAIDYVQASFNTKKIVTYGGSAGASGSFYIGKDQDNVAAVIMDSFAVDLSAIRDGCYEDMNVFGAAYPCFCPEGGPTCMEVLAPRIGFNFGVDEPYKIVETGFNKPIYLVWNENDASRFAYLHYENLHRAIEQFNPGGNSVANKVCITNPESPPGPTCNLHVPSAYDYPETESLVEEISTWALNLLGDSTQSRINIPLVLK